MRIALFAYSSTGSSVYRALCQLGAPPQLVVTHPAPPGEPLWFEPVAALARNDGVPVHEATPDRHRHRAPYHHLVAAARPDVILSAYFRALLPAGILALAGRGAYNLHGSLLPRYRGRAPVNWVLVHGESATGMTLHHMIAAADAGDIVDQLRLDIGPDETAPELQSRLDVAAAVLVRRWLPAIARGSAPRRPQDPSLSTYFRRRTPEDGRFDWSWPAARIHNLVRAVTRPFPGAFVDEPEGRLRVWRTRLVGPARDRLELVESEREHIA